MRFLVAMTPEVYDQHPYPDFDGIEAETPSDAVVAFCKTREGESEFRLWPGPNDGGGGVWYVEMRDPEGKMTNNGYGWQPYGCFTVQLWEDVGIAN